MTDVKARFVGHPDGADITVPLANGELRNVHIPHGGELPNEIDKVRVPAAFRDSLLEQSDNWTTVKRDTSKASAGKDGDS